MTDEEWEATFVTPYLPEPPEIDVCGDLAPDWALIAFWVVVLTLFGLTAVTAVMAVIR